MVALLLAGPLRAGVDPEGQRFDMDGVGITERLGDSVPADLVFRDETGRDVELGDYLDGERPVLLSLVYYNCPGMCVAQLRGMVSLLRDMEWTAGGPFQVVSVSIDPLEGPEIAAPKKASHVEAVGRPETAEGWAFLTGDEPSITALAEAVGFEYRWVEDVQEFAHDVALIVLTPEGRISRYLRGVHYEPDTVRMSLVEASGGRIGSLSDRVWVRLCGYDPRYGKYVVQAQRVMTVGGAATLLVMGIALALAWRHEKRKRKEVVSTHA